MPNKMNVSEFLQRRMGIEEERVVEIVANLEALSGITTINELVGAASVNLLCAAGVAPALAPRVLIELQLLSSAMADVGGTEMAAPLEGTQKKSKSLAEYQSQFCLGGEFHLILPKKTDCFGISVRCASQEKSGFYIDPSGINFVSFTSECDKTDSVGRFTQDGLVTLQLLHVGRPPKPTKLYKALFVPSLTLVAIKSFPILRSGKRNELANQLRVLFKNAKRVLVQPRSLAEPALLASDDTLFSDIAPGKFRISVAENGDADDLRWFCKYFDTYINPGAGGLDIVLEFCSGRSLKDQMTMGKQWTLEDLTVICYSVLQGLAVLQKNSLAHGKVKPSNILVTDDGRILLSDFGMTSINHSINIYSESHIVDILYSSPEKLERSVVTGESDVWALGVTLIVLLTRENPFFEEGESVNKTIEKIIRELPPIDERIESMYPLVHDFIKRCLVPDPAKRATVQELLTSPLIIEGITRGVLPPAPSSSSSAPDQNSATPVLHQWCKHVSTDDELEAIVEAAISWQLALMGKSLFVPLEKNSTPEHSSPTGSQSSEQQQQQQQQQQAQEPEQEQPEQPEEPEEPDESEVAHLLSAFVDPGLLHIPPSPEKPLRLARYRENTLKWLAQQLRVPWECVAEKFESRCSEVNLELERITNTITSTTASSQDEQPPSPDTPTKGISLTYLDGLPTIPPIRTSLSRLRKMAQHKTVLSEHTGTWWERPGQCHLSLKTRANEFNVAAPRSRDMQKLFLDEIPKSDEMFRRRQSQWNRRLQDDAGNARDSDSAALHSSLVSPSSASVGFQCMTPSTPPLTNESPTMRLDSGPRSRAPAIQLISRANNVINHQHTFNALST